jgi:hypothetical protein
MALQPIHGILKRTYAGLVNDGFVGGKLAFNCAKVALLLTLFLGVVHKGAER